MKKTFHIVSLTLATCSVLTACNATSSSYSPLRVTFEGGSSNQAARTLPADDNASAIQALAFGEFEIVAYDYRPGETVQNSSQFSVCGYEEADVASPDWSYYVVLQSGQTSARQVTLAPDQVVDINALNGDFTPTVDDAFVSQVGKFDIDLFEVDMYRNGVIQNGNYYGADTAFNDDDPPAYGGIPLYNAVTQFSGFPATVPNTNVFFVRDDWFLQPVLVDLDEASRDSDGNITHEIAWSSTSLTDAQSALLLSLADQGTCRRFYSNLVVIPYGAVQSVDFAAGQELAVNVSFDVANSVDMNRTDFAALQEGTADTLYFSSDENGVPFGLKVSFGAE